MRLATARAVLPPVWPVSGLARSAGPPSYASHSGFRSGLPLTLLAGAGGLVLPLRGQHTQAGVADGAALCFPFNCACGHMRGHHTRALYRAVGRSSASAGLPTAVRSAPSSIKSTSCIDIYGIDLGVTRPYSAMQSNQERDHVQH